MISSLGRRLGLWSGRLALCGSILLAPATVGAQERSVEITGLAADHYERGRELYAEGKFEEAARELRRAYDRAPHPLLLYNIALAEWRSGHVPRALETAKRADVMGLDPSLADRNRALIRGIEVLTTATGMSERASARPGASMEAPSPARDEGGVGWLAPGLLAVGAASLAGAAWFNHRLSENQGPYEDAARRSDADTYDELNAELKRDQAIGLVFLGVGVLSAATGATLLLFDLFGSDEPEAVSRAPGLRLDVRPSARAATLELTVEFD